MAGPWEDYAPKVTRAAGPWDDYSAEAQRGIIDTLTAPLRYGASQAARGYQSTLHETGNDDAGAGVVGAAGAMIAPESYTPSDVAGKLKGGRYWDAVKDIPKAVAESVPGMAPDIAAGMAGAGIGAAVGGPFAPITAAVGGVLGAGTSYAARNYGNDARSSARARGADDNSELTTGDKVRALLASSIGGITSRVGLGALGTPVKAGAGTMASQLIPQIGRGAAIDTATNVAQEAANQAIIHRELDPSKLAAAAMTGAATGVGLRGIAAIKDVNASSKFADSNLKEANPLANDLLGVVGSPHKAGNPADSYYRVDKVADQYSTAADKALGVASIKERLKVLKENNENDNTASTITDVQSDIAKGRKLNQDQLDLIDRRLGDVNPGGPSITDIFKRQAELNDLKTKGNWDTAAKTFTGGVSSTPFAQNYLNPAGHTGRYASAGAGLYALTGGTLPGLSALHAVVDPMSAIAVPAGQAATFAGLHVMDRLTGSRNPVKLYTNRFGSEPTGAPTATPGWLHGDPQDGRVDPRGPSGADIAASVSAAKADVLAGKVAGKEADKTARQDQKALAVEAGRSAKRELWQQNWEHTDAAALNKTHNDNVARTEKSKADLERTQQNQERGDANIKNREYNQNVAKQKKSEADLELFQQNEQHRDAAALNKAHNENIAKTTKSAADLERFQQINERGDATILNKAHDANLAATKKSASDLELFQQNEQHRDGVALNRAYNASVAKAKKSEADLELFHQNNDRGDAVKMNRAHDRNVAALKKAADDLELFNQNQQRRDAGSINQKFNAGATALKRAAESLARQRQAQMGKDAATEFNGPVSDATMAMRLVRLKESLRKGREKADAVAEAVTRTDDKRAATAQRTADRDAATTQRRDDAVISKSKPTIAQRIKWANFELKDGTETPAPKATSDRDAAKSASQSERVKQKATGAKDTGPVTTPIVTKYGTRNQIVDDITVSERAIQNGMNKRNGTRAQAMEDMLTVPLSKDGHHYMIDHVQDILDNSFANSNSHTARDHIETILDGMSNADKKLMRAHFAARGYYKSWKD